MTVYVFKKDNISQLDNEDTFLTIFIGVWVGIFWGVMLPVAVLFGLSGWVLYCFVKIISPKIIKLVKHVGDNIIKWKK